MCFWSLFLVIILVKHVFGNKMVIFLVEKWLYFPSKMIIFFSVSDPYHFDVDPDPDPDPRIRIRDDGSGSGL